MNRRKQSNQLTPADIQKLHAAHDRAIEISLPLNVFVTVDSVDKQGINSPETHQTFRTFQGHLWQFGNRFDFPMAYVWVGEAGEPNGYNPHRHYLIHVPPAHYDTFHRLAHTQAGGRWLPGDRTIDVKPVHDIHYLLNNYFIKQSEQGRGETGALFGKRVGMSRVLSPNRKGDHGLPYKRQSFPVAADYSPQQFSVF